MARETPCVLCYVPGFAPSTVRADSLTKTPYVEYQVESVMGATHPSDWLVLSCEQTLEYGTDTMRTPCAYLGRCIG